ncbi:NXPE family member 4-like [Corticium candelabrum]|uniref:NXPE family member 4-like n=1 Tax=Corticium candelabrum TaxID=121492 RepID=UPI002E25A21C|nr:NXPE family member 4-like [Corticium candelabrum]
MATSHESETAAATSSWNIVSEVITVGRPFYVLLTARDTKGNKKRTGGDMFNAVLRGKVGSVPTSVAGEVTDFSNGSYLITFVPPCSGKASIDVRLWLSSHIVDVVKATIDANYIFSCTFGNNRGINIKYVGPHSRDSLLKIQATARKTDSIAVRVCHMDGKPDRLPRFDSSCDMKFRYKYDWYGVCEGPHSPNSTACDSIQWCVYHNKMMYNNEAESARGRRHTGAVTSKVKSILILNGDKPTTTEFSKEICKRQPFVKPTGYWLGNRWINRDCSFQCDTKEKWWKCLTNRELYLIGDSTVRQLHIVVLSSIGLMQPKLSLYIPENLLNTYVKKYNATIRYRLHGLPLQTTLGMNFTGATFVADTIDAIQANGNEIILISTIQHFLLLPPDIFRQRMEHMVTAVRHLRQRKMGKTVPVIFSTGNPRGFDSFRLNSYRIKWYNQIVAETFAAADVGIIVYDVFDMMASSADPQMPHQSQQRMAVKLSQILSLACQ